MRVISGTARGKKLESLSGTDTRPTTDRVKESVFNLIMPYIEDAEVLDAFAGSGALGIEALSRGSASCVFLDNNPSAMQIVRQNLVGTRLSDKAKTAVQAAEDFLRSTAQTFDLIFLDPPYDSGVYAPILSLIERRGLLKDGGVISVEMRADMPLPETKGLRILKDRKYGKTRIYIVCREDAE